MFILLFFVHLVFSEIFVVLLSGIRPWNDLGYASEADTYQTYYQFTEICGISHENILLFVMDGVANDPNNKYPGKIFDYPTGNEIYGFAKDHFDYVYKDTNPTSFIDVLTGKDPGVGTHRILKSTEEDYVYIQTMSHGSPGVFLFVYEESQYLYLHAADLHDAVTQIKSKQTIIYFNSCYSGSMFNGLYPKDGNVIALTGAPPDSFAYVCCENKTLGIKMDSCFHTRWQYDSRQKIKEKTMDKTTINDEYQDVLNMMDWTEQYCIYGNLNASKTVTLDKFQGTPKSDAKVNTGKCVDQRRRKFGDLFERTPEREEIDYNIWGRFVKDLKLKVENKPNYDCYPNPIKDLQCHKAVFTAALEKCNFYASYNKETALLFNDACNQVGDTEEIVGIIDKICSSFNIEKEYDQQMYNTK